jgi:hypothetical protein
MSMTVACTIGLEPPMFPTGPTEVMVTPLEPPRPGPAVSPLGRTPGPVGWSFGRLGSSEMLGLLQVLHILRLLLNVLRLLAHVFSPLISFT